MLHTHTTSTIWEPCDDRGRKSKRFSFDVEREHSSEIIHFSGNIEIVCKKANENGEKKMVVDVSEPEIPNNGEIKLQLKYKSIAACR